MDVDTIGQQELLSQEQFINKIKTDDEFAKQWGELGPIYGSQWRSWKQWHVKNYVGGNIQIDQIANLISELKTNPDSRRLMVNAWNVGELDQMVLPPCHYGFQVYTRELSLNERRNWCKSNNVILEHLEAGLENEEDDMRANRVPTRSISLMWNQRSVDTFLGLPFNIASYGLLLEIIAKEVNMVPDELIGNLGDVHLYKNHIEQAAEQCSRTPYELPEVRLRNYNTLEELLETKDHTDNIQLWRYDSHPSIKAPLSN
jgi:thymidylate synthase